MAKKVQEKWLSVSKIRNFFCQFSHFGKTFFKLQIWILMMISMAKSLIWTVFTCIPICDKNTSKSSSRVCKSTKVSFLGLCSKMQIIPIKNLNIKKVVPQFLWFFRLKCWFKGQIISRIHLNLPNAYKLMCFDRNINGNRDVKFLIGIIGHCTDERNLL